MLHLHTVGILTVVHVKEVKDRTDLVSFNLTSSILRVLSVVFQGHVTD